MRRLPWLILITVFAVYAGIVAAFGFPEWLGLTIHFARTSVIMAVLILYLPAIAHIFTTVPAPYRDFLLAAIILNSLSNESFSVWNEMGRVFGVDTSIFTSPVAGLFSLMLVIAGISFLKAVETENKHRWITALVVAVIFSTLLVIVAPYFR